MYCRITSVSLLRMAYAPSSACAVSEEVDNRSFELLCAAGSMEHFLYS